MNPTLVGEPGCGKAMPRLIRTEQELKEAVAHLLTFDHFVVDVECPKVDDEFQKIVENSITWIGFAVPDRVVLIPMGHDRGPMKTPGHKEKRIPPDEQRKVLKNGTLSTAKKLYTVEPTYWDGGIQLRPDVVFEALEPLFFSDRKKIGHNVKFDLESITKYFGGRLPPGPYADTLVMSHVVNENRLKYDLKTLTMDWLKVPKDPKVRQKFYPNLGKIGVESQPMDQVARYLAKDVWYCLQYHTYLTERLSYSPKLIDVFTKDEMTVYPLVMKQELQGVRIDTALLKERGDKLLEQMEDLTQQIWDLTGESWEITNGGRKIHFLFDSKESGGQGLKPLTYTEKKQQPQVTQEVLEYYSEKNELAALLLEWSDKQKQHSTFIVGLNKALVGDRLHASFNQHRTVTGRFSSSNPNLHQIPRGPFFRDCFIADEGCKLIVADYSQMELRIAADMSKDPEMMRVFLEDLDIHREAAAAMLQMPQEDVSDVLRMIGKTQNLGTLYGAGSKKITKVAKEGGVPNMTEKRGQEFVDAYNERFKVMTAWKRDIVIQAKASVKAGDKRHPFVEIPPYGRMRRLPMLFSMDKGHRAKAERQAVNSIVQGNGAYILKQAMRDLDVTLGPNSPIKVVMNVHDELIATCPEGVALEALELVKNTMEAVRSPDGTPVIGEVPLKVNAAIADRWSEGK
jgi:DNA polymerase-1